MTHDELLANPLEVMFLPVMGYAMLIEQQYGQFLLPPPEGIYRIGEADPCIYPNRMYYTKKEHANGHIERNPITDFENAVDKVVDDSDRLIIPEYMMRNKHQYLKQEPTIPVRGIMMVEMLVNNHIATISQYSKYNHFTRKVESQIHPDHLNLSTDGHLERVCEPLLMQVNNFIGNDNWNIYFVKRIQAEIVVEKCCDYRIYQYHLGNEQ